MGPAKGSGRGDSNLSPAVCDVPLRTAPIATEVGVMRGEGGKGNVLGLLRSEGSARQTAPHSLGVNEVTGPRQARYGELAGP